MPSFPRFFRFPHPVCFLNRIIARSNHLLELASSSHLPKFFAYASFTKFTCPLLSEIVKLGTIGLEKSEWKGIEERFEGVIRNGLAALIIVLSPFLQR